MKRYRIAHFTLGAMMGIVAIGIAACGGGGGGGSSTIPTTLTATPTPVPTQTAIPTPTASPTASPTPLNVTAVPLGTYSSTTPAVGVAYSCQSAFNGIGNAAGPWINLTTMTWNENQKVSVSGSVSWNAATNSFASSGTTLTVATNDLPKGFTTGTFPIASSDPAHQYDQNPNSIAAQSLSYTLPLAPTIASSPGCLNGGPIGVTTTGVAIYDGLDALGRDAAAYEVVDTCGGHPQGSGQYHYHTIVASCNPDTPDATGHSSLIGYAGDGFGIYGNLGTGGMSLTNAYLDRCHGHTHSVLFHGVQQTIYHYHVTKEFPYTVGCYEGSKAQGF